ncbi:unnamed protein product [Prunus armeniaca]|uniref:Uncharacterized protein n=1 Tax=Prunus armeniaca TaxID=36596 RepID=A0A6J5XJS2_PRUAR|nr:unnamed protein product [Prunus armeniaca]CAB4314080.1 unnamed protein product [Prunus armeniaca]
MQHLIWSKFHAHPNSALFSFRPFLVSLEEERDTAKPSSAEVGLVILHRRLRLSSSSSESIEFEL